MTDRFLYPGLLKKSTKYPLSSLSPTTETADSGIASRSTPVSLVHDDKSTTNTNNEHDDNLDKKFSKINNYSHCFVNLVFEKPKLKYKIPPEYMEFPQCLITYLDHASSIFVQMLNTGRAFQLLHQHLNQYYMEHLNAYDRLRIDSFEIGDFCVAYSARYFEFYRARILKIDHQYKRCLVIFVDFGNSEWIQIKALRPLHIDFSQLETQCVAVTLSHILPKKDRTTGLINWNTTTGKQCTQNLRRLLLKNVGELPLFVSVTFLPKETWWSLSFVDIKIDGQDLAEIIHHDGLARLTHNNKDLRNIYPKFGQDRSECLIFGLTEPNRLENHSSAYG